MRISFDRLNLIVAEKMQRRVLGGGVWQAELPTSAKPLDKTIASANLLASNVVSKYADHLRLHRQEEIFKRLGVDVPRKSMCEWIEEVCDN